MASPTPRAVAAYLVDLRGPLGEATQYRQAWVQRIGLLMEDARGGHPLTITQTAGQIGREHGANFRRVRDGFAGLRPPSSCMAVHGAFGRWLDKLIEACDLLTSVARTGDIQRLRETEGLFSEGRRHAHVFNEEYARVADNLRQRVSAVQRDRTRHPERPRARRPSRDPWPSKPRPTVGTRSF
jgi:hypothetical protein